MDTLDRKADSLDPPSTGSAERWALVLMWNRRRAAGVGEVAWLEGNQPHLVGRAGGPGENRVLWTRGQDTPGVGIGGSYVSRQALELTPIGPVAVGARNVGRLKLRVNGHPASHASLSDGDVLELDGELILLLQRRSPQPPRDGWGEPDADGMVGEGPAMTHLRQRMQQVGSQAGHVLVLGESGTGKESVARGVHRLSNRHPLVTCNAAAIPEGVAEAEWFGNQRNYPNPGMPARKGLAGEADGGSLFVDELGELPQRVQAQLLRLLDSGEVQRLGADRPETVDLRLIAATNRGPEAIKPDVAARFVHHIHTPALGERAEDLPFLLQHLLQGDLARFNPDGVPRVTPRFFTAMIRRNWTGHVRELLHLLYESAAMAARERNWLDLPPGMRAIDEEPPPSVDPKTITAEAIKDALAAAKGVKTRAADHLGLRSRHQLRRLMQKYGLT